MLRPLLAFGCLALTAFLLAPTVQSVHEQVEALDIKRDLPHLWKWDRQDPPPLLPPICSDEFIPLYSEVDHWPTRIRKNETFSVAGFVRENHNSGGGVGGVTVDLFLNETKELPGIALGTVTTSGDGRFKLTTSLPYELQATKYHLVAHALEMRLGCVVYVEHWSDPEMEVTSPTRVELYPPESPVVGHPFTLRGRVFDEVGAPVQNANVTVTIDGAPRSVRTDDMGQFVIEHKVDRPTTFTWSARFDGTKYYGASRGEAKVEVLRDELRLDMSTMELVRSRATPVSGALVLPPGAKAQPLSFTFEGVKVAECVGCPAKSVLNVTPDAGGNFTLTIVAGPDQTPGAFKVVAKGGGLAEPREIPGRVLIPVSVALVAENDGPIGKDLSGRVMLVDEVGRPHHGPVAVETASGWSTGAVDETGNYTFSVQAAECGAQPVRALYNGTAEAMPAVSTQEVTMCPLVAAIPPWLFNVPWWAWPLAALVVFALVKLAMRRRNAVAPYINRGPALTLVHTLPDDAAEGIVAQGETAVLMARLEAPLPEGHTLRMGPARKTTPVTVGEDLCASFTFTPERLGEHPVRAEILDARGRVVTRRTATVHAVRYAEEIETRYRRLRGEAGASEAVTPREFEAWLHERRPDLDPAVVARLTGIFEEADYGPRTAGRAELIAYLEAEAAVPPQEVTPHALA